MPRTPELPDFAASQLFLRRLAYSLVRDPSRVDDLVQDTWAAWVERRPENVAEPRAWLARVLRNHAFNLKRGDERRARREAFAGRPDPSGPETDGTLEAQEQLLAALRALDEPYRSTLVQRYYHDLSPKEIAERSGAPLDTVKSRLARGLERLRSSMDTRYRGDRGAWCHWLASLANPPPPVMIPGVPRAPVAAAAGAGASSALAWVGALAAIAAAVTWRAVSTRATEVAEPRTRERVEAPPEPEPRVARERDAPPRATSASAASSHEVPEADPEAAPKKELELRHPWMEPKIGSPVVRGERETLEWPQYAGSARHAVEALPEDGVLMPEVQWYLPGLSGQPTLSGGELYSGGFALARVDPIGGVFLSAPDPSELLTSVLAGLVESSEDVRPWMVADLQHRIDKLRPGKLEAQAIAAAPVITPGLVLVRRTRDGGVDAYPRLPPADPRTPVWSWTPPDADVLRFEHKARVPLCLADEGVVLVAHEKTLFALALADGKLRWSLAFSSPVHMVPASADGRVFVGTADKMLLALDVASGEVLWRARVDTLGGRPPVVVGERVLCVTGTHVPGAERVDRLNSACLHLLRCDDGTRLWSTENDDFAGLLPGLGPDAGYALMGRGSEVVRIALADGRVDETKRVQAPRRAFLSPTVVGKSLVFGALDGALHVHDLESGRLRWTFDPPQGSDVEAFVHSGKRIYVATKTGLFCIGDDPLQAPPAEGFVLEWNGDVGKPFQRAARER